MKSPARQRGFLLIAAVILIVTASIFAVAISYMMVAGNLAGSGTLGSAQALALAESGLERALQFVNASSLGTRVACTGITGHASLTNQALGSGEYTVTTGNGGTPYYPATPATLSAAVSASATILPVSTLTGYSSAGRVLIDRESIDYAATSTDAAVCGVGLAPCLISAQRGRDGTTAAAHATGATLGQNQCDLVSQGGVPSVATAMGLRTVSAGVQQQEGWIVGNLGGSATNEDINAISCTGTNNCWGVADNGVLVHWNGSGWTQDSYTAPDHLRGISCPDANTCYAVGDQSGGEVILQLSGGTWSRVGPSGALPNTDLNSIHCADANNCIAVGDNGVIFRLNAGAWTSVASPVTSDINGVYCTGATSCWAVGDVYDPPGPGGNQEVILQWTGGAWSLLAAVGSIPNTNLNSVHCPAAGTCFAVGDEQGSEVILQLSGGTWSRVGPLAGVPNEDLNSIYCLDANNCFAVGDNGTLARMSGGAWSDISGTATGEDMNGVWCFATNDCIAIGDNGTVLRWDGTSWASTVAPALLRWNGETWSNASGLLDSGINLDLRAVTALSYADGWMVGETGGGAVAPCTSNRARIGRWGGSSWACSASSPSNRNLNSVSAVSYDDAWAVGANGSIVRWTGAAWSEQNAAQNITGRELHAVHALNSSEIWVTGRFETQGGKTCANNRAVILRWTGAWSCQNTGAPARRYRGMFMFADGADAGTQPDDGWIVGDRNNNDFTIYRWNNPTANQWNSQSFTDNTYREQLNSVYVLDTDGDGLGDDGWAVGSVRNNYLTILRWNHACAGGAATGAWTVCSFNPGSAALRQSLNAVYCTRSTDCWAAGNSGLILHFDGSGWSVHSQSGGMPGALTTANLNGMSFLGARSRTHAVWRELFP
jgi:hypothetical protein